MLTVVFEDRGQDFLEWDIKGGIVVACRPFQEWLWKGYKVLNTDIKPGDILQIARPAPRFGLRKKAEDRMTIKYPVKRVKGKRK